MHITHILDFCIGVLQHCLIVIGRGPQRTRPERARGGDVVVVTEGPVSKGLKARVETLIVEACVKDGGFNSFWLGYCLDGMYDWKMERNDQGI